MKSNLKYLYYAILICLAFVLFRIFSPRTYNVPQLQKRESILYWNLPTGSKIAYNLIAAKGPKKPFPVIFLQGGPGGFISERNISALAPLADDGYDVYLYDQIGSGQSERLGNIEAYTAERHKKDLEEIVRQIGAEKVILIGQSWGGILATLFVADNESKVDKIIFTGPVAIQPLRRELLSIAAPDSLQLKKPPYSNRQGNEKYANLRSKAMTFCAKYFGVKLAGDKEADDFQTLVNSELRKAVVCDTSKAVQTQGGGGFYVEIMTMQSLNDMKDPRPRLRRCSMPVLVMKGQCDAQPWGFVQEYMDIFPNHRLKIVPDAGHSIAVEQPEVYIATIRGFLNEKSKTEGE